MLKCEFQAVSNETTVTRAGESWTAYSSQFTIPRPPQNNELCQRNPTLLRRRARRSNEFSGGRRNFCYLSHAYLYRRSSHTGQRHLDHRGVARVSGQCRGVLEEGAWLRRHPLATGVRERGGGTVGRAGPASYSPGDVHAPGSVSVSCRNATFHFWQKTFRDSRRRIDKRATVVAAGNRRSHAGAVHNRHLRWFFRWRNGDPHARFAGHDKDGRHSQDECGKESARCGDQWRCRCHVHHWWRGALAPGYRHDRGRGDWRLQWRSSGAETRSKARARLCNCGWLWDDRVLFVAVLKTIVNCE